NTVTLNSGSMTASLGDKNIDTEKPVTVTEYTISGADAGNYTVSQPTRLAADITAKNLTITGAAANSKVYDRTATAMLNFGSANLVGVVSPDAVTINSSAALGTFADKNVGTAQPVAVTGVTLSGADAGNYTVSQPAGLTADITAKNLTITRAAANNRVYDRTLTAMLSFGTASL